MPQSYTPSDPSFNRTINVYKDGDPASGNEMAAPLKALQDNMVAHREKDVVASQDGSHGLRYYMDKLEHYDEDDEEWKEIETGGSSSVVVITTDNSNLFGEDVTLQQDVYTFTGTFGDGIGGEATARVKVSYIGTYTVTSNGVTVGTITVTAAGGIYYLDDTTHIWGYKVQNSDSNTGTRVTYTDDATGYSPMTMNLTTGDVSDWGSWEDHWLIQQFRPVMLKSNGTVDYELNHDDQQYKLDGVTASDISNTSYDGNAMIGVKPIWIYRYEADGYKYVKFSNKKVNNNYKCHANTADDGSTILDEVYTYMFKGSVINNKVRSLAGQTQMNNVAGATEISYAQANGSGWYLNDWAFVKLWEDLAYLFGCNTDAGSVFGKGHDTGGSSASSLLTTGTTKAKGPFYGTSGNVAMKFLWKENAWGDRWDRTAGCMLVGGKIKVKMYPPYNDTGNGYEDTGITPGGTSGGYISAGTMTENGFIPSTASGTDSTYWPDGLWYNTSTTAYAIVGGACNGGLLCGPSCLLLGSALSPAAWGFGPSLSYRRPVAA